MAINKIKEVKTAEIVTETTVQDETATVVVQETPEEPPIAVVPVEEKRVRIVPRRSVNTVRIGNDYYSFLQGVAMDVPVSVRDHLQEKGIL